MPYIDRDIIERLIMKDGLYCDTDADKLYSVKRIRSLPTADVVERKNGKWVECDHDKWYGDTFAYKCSECDGAYHLNIEQTIAVWNFWPNCGADMRGGDNEG